MGVWIHEWVCEYRNSRVDTGMGVWIPKCACGYRNGCVDTGMRVWIQECVCGFRAMLGHCANGLNLIGCLDWKSWPFNFFGKEVFNRDKQRRVH